MVRVPQKPRKQDSKLNSTYKEPSDAKPENWRNLRRAREEVLTSTIGGEATNNLLRAAITKKYILYIRNQRGRVQKDTEGNEATILEDDLKEDDPRTSSFCCGVCTGVCANMTCQPCTHVYCKDCIELCIEQNAQYSKTCPTCRAKYPNISKKLVNVSWLVPGPAEAEGCNKMKSAAKKVKRKLKKHQLREECLKFNIVSKSLTATNKEKTRRERNIAKCQVVDMHNQLIKTTSILNELANRHKRLHSG
ncbi:hypothetical protein FRC02_000238 [Tulasnella sp. 418]|nr:hypothetical protein FRC02_000238 [Tulasnella sp. 418]